MRSSVADARELAERAAAPLVRRSWEHLSVASRAEDGVALAFAGERGAIASEERSSCHIVFDGELFTAEGVTSGEPAARRILRAYLAHGSETELPEGSFAAVVWDARFRRAVVFGDRYASRPLYLSETDDTQVIAGELKSIVACGHRRSWGFERSGWAQLLAYEHLLPGATPLDGVSSMRPATTVVLSEGMRRKHERWRYRLEPEPDGDERELVEEFARLLARAVAKRLDGTEAFAVSGGLDSRCVAAVLADAGLSPLAASYGAPGSEDLLLGAEVARQAGLPHHSLPLPSGYLESGASEVVSLTEGRVRCLHAHHLALRELRRSCGAGSLLIGFGGDDTVRWVAPPRVAGDSAFDAAVHRIRAHCVTDELAGDLLTEEFAAEIRGLAAYELAASLRADEGSEDERFSQLLFRNTQAPTVFDDHFAVRDPYADHELVDFCRRLPLRFRRGGYLQRAFLRRYPALAGLPLPHGAVAPAVRGWREDVSRRLAGLRRACRPRHPLEGIGSYAADLRAGSRRLLDVLLEERTLARGQIRREALQRLATDLDAGRLIDTRAVGMLLTLELFQRQLIEGDRVEAASLADELAA